MYFKAAVLSRNVYGVPPEHTVLGRVDWSWSDWTRD